MSEIVFDPPLDLDIDPIILKDALQGLAPLPLEEIKTAIDIGAHAGAVTCALARFGAQVLAVEPLRIARLARNVEQNQLQRKVTILQAAVDVMPRQILNLRCAGNDAMCGTQFLMDRSLDEGRALSVTPDKLLELFGPAEFVKVDIEGAEWLLLMYGEFDDLFDCAKFVDLELHGEGEFFPSGFTTDFDVPAYMEGLGFKQMAGINKQQLWRKVP